MRQGSCSRITARRFFLADRVPNCNFVFFFHHLLACSTLCLLYFCSVRFSGVTEKDLAAVTVSLEDIQRHLLSLFTADTILVGHSLESDLKAVKVNLDTWSAIALSRVKGNGKIYQQSLLSLI